MNQASSLPFPITDRVREAMAVTLRGCEELIPLFEGAVVEQQLDALARRQLALGMLGVDALLAAALGRAAALFVQLVDDFMHGRFSRKTAW